MPPPRQAKAVKIQNNGLERGAPPALTADVPSARTVPLGR